MKLVTQALAGFALNATSIAFTVNIKSAGDLVALLVSFGNNSGPAPGVLQISDTAGNTWTQGVYKEVHNGFNGCGFAIFYCTALTAGSTSIKINYQAVQGSTWQASFLEFSGVVPTVLGSGGGADLVTTAINVNLNFPGPYMVIAGAGQNSAAAVFSIAGQTILADSASYTGSVALIYGDGYAQFTGGGPSTVGFTTNQGNTAKAWGAVAFMLPFTPSVPIPVKQSSVSQPALAPAGVARPCGTHIAVTSFDFSLYTVQHFDLADLPNTRLQNIKTVFVDMSNALAELTLTADDTNQVLVIAPQTQGYYPFFSGSGKVTARATSSQTGLQIPVIFFDTLIPPGVWPANATPSTQISGVVTVNPGAGTFNENISQVGGAAISLGQTVKASSLPVTLASDQGNLPENLTQVGGAALSLGQKVMASSVPVAVASDQGNLPVNVAQIGGVAAGVANFNLNGNSPNAAGTAAGATISGLGSYHSLAIYAQLTGATGGTLDVYLQYSPDGGTTWVDYLHFAQLVAAAPAASFAIAVSRAGQQTTIQPVGSGLTPALAANTVVGGDFGDRLRVVFVAGASTTAGAAQTILIAAAS